jgi:cysteine desulfurase
MHGPIYLDNHATTRTDPRVVEAMLPLLSERFGNASSTSHAWGREAHEAVEAARATIAQAIGARPEEIVFTSGATESNNLAIRGIADRLALDGQHFVSVATEHRTVLDPLARLRRRGARVSWLPVQPSPSAQMGRLDLQGLAEAIPHDTVLVSVMLANNEIGVVHPVAAVAEICAARNVLLHSDATQAVGKIPLDVRQLGVDLMSFSAHKLYGPKGIGALYIRRRSPPIRLAPLIDGGGQEKGLRSGTLNVPGIVGFARAIQLSVQEVPAEIPRLGRLRQQLYQGLSESIEGCQLNGPAWETESQLGQLRLPGNLNMSFRGVDGQTIMLNSPEVATSSGSACSANYPEPSHVLRALGLDDDVVRSSLRFGLGRFNTADEISRSVEILSHTVRQLRRLGPLGA